MRNPKREQARFSIRVAMLRAGLTNATLARRIGHDPAVVSKAINHGQFPRVFAKIQKEVSRAG